MIWHLCFWFYKVCPVAFQETPQHKFLWQYFKYKPVGLELGESLEKTQIQDPYPDFWEALTFSILDVP